MRRLKKTWAQFEREVEAERKALGIVPPKDMSRIDFEHIANRFIDTIAPYVSERQRRKRDYAASVDKWQLLFYRKQEDEKIMLFKTTNESKPYRLSVKGGGHPVVGFDFDSWASLRAFYLELGRSANLLTLDDAKQNRWVIKRTPQKRARGQKKINP